MGKELQKGRLILYLTLGDQPSGVFRSQVEDVVNFLRIELSLNIRLVAFISIRNFFANRRRIKKNVSGSFILPMFPALKNWRYNKMVLYAVTYFLKPGVLFSRGVFASALSIKCRERGLVEAVVYDGRGAISAEWTEYNIGDDLSIRAYMRELERSVILKSDRQLAVSRKLVEYWKDEFKFNKNTYRVIPSTLRRAFSSIGLSGLEILERRKAFGIKRGDVVLVYSGSSAEWQSYDMMFDFVKGTLNRQRNVFIFFLADGNRYIRDLTEAFGERVRQFLVPPEKVPFYLEMCDFGLMIREKTTTNRVASPVKFAEYLASGLKVIVSDGIGDCSSMVKSLDLGFFYNETPGDLEPLTEEDRCRSRGAAISHFSKDAYSNFYLDLLNSRPE